MKITIKERGEAVVLKIIGNIKYDDIDYFVEVVEGEFRRGTKKFVFDLSQMPYINSAVIGQFVNILKKVNQFNGKIAFCNVRPYIQNIIEITGLSGIFHISPDVSSALRAVRK
ncbi:MAG: STAS domain-containing protein [Candidatus Muiribacteriota bacterium]